MTYSLPILIITLCTVLTHQRKQCFKTKQPSTSQQGPLKISLADPIKDFQSGSYTIVNNNVQKPSRFNCFNITFLYINGKNPYEVVASIQNIDNYQDKEGLDFSVRFATSQTSIQGLFIMSKTASWTSVSIHYLISAREDFRLGTFVPQTVQFLPCGRQSSDLVISHKIIKPWNASNNLIFGLPFLSGIRTIDTQISVYFNKSTFSPNTSLLQIPTKFNQVQQPIEYLLIGYLIVTMDSEFQITNIYDLNYIPTDINVFVGMTGVQTAAPNQNGTQGVLKATNILNKNKFRQFFAVQGLVIQSQTNLDLLFSDGSVKASDVLQCISPQRCQGYDGYMKFYQNQQNFIFHSQCILCQKFASYNNRTQQCQCRQLYTRSQNGSCVLKRQMVCIEDFQVFNASSKKCQCIVGYIEADKRCILNTTKCPAGFTSFKGSCFRINWNSNSSNNTTAIAPSTPNSSFVADSARNNICPINDMIYNQTTKQCQCSNNRTYDSLNKICYSCKQSQSWSNQTKKCQCLSGSFKINGTCSTCSLNGYFNGTGCQCLKGFLGDGKNCLKDPNFSTQTLGLMISLKPQSLLPDSISKNPKPASVPLSAATQPSTGLPINRGAVVLGTIPLD